MPISNDIFNIPSLLGFGFALKAFAILFAAFYVIFALIIFRQTQLMAKALPSAISPFLKFIAILQIGAALALLSSVIGVF